MIEHYTQVKSSFLISVGALDGKLFGIVSLHEAGLVDDKRFIEFVKEAYTTYQGEKK